MTTITKNNHFLQALATMTVSAIVASSMMTYSATPAHAAQTYTVNTAGNAIGTGGCNAIECTLNEALLEANANPGVDSINFNIPGGSGPRTISPTFELPTITDPVIIDGYSQPGAEENTLAKGGTNAKPLIVLNGSSIGDASANGLGIGDGGASSKIRGLVINNFPNNGIEVADRAGVEIEGNFIGTDASGTVDAGNGDDGVDVQGDAGSGSVVVGGFTPAERNLISGNGDPGSDGVGVQLIQGSNHLVAGNLIGTARDGIANLGNSSSGLYIGTDATIGGTSDRANIIAFNGDVGVTVVNDSASILNNSIFSNGEQGIDLSGSNGQDPNDVGDGDTGANGLQNHPVLQSAKSGKKASIKGELGSKANQTYRLQFFTNPASTDEGKVFLGERTVTTNSTGLATFTFKPSQAAKKLLKPGQAVTATATDAAGNTSEFSDSREVRRAR